MATDRCAAHIAVECEVRLFVTTSFVCFATGVSQPDTSEEAQRRATKPPLMQKIEARDQGPLEVKQHEIEQLQASR